MAGKVEIIVEGRHFATTNSFCRHLAQRYGIHPERVMELNRTFGAQWAIRAARMHWLSTYWKPAPHQLPPQLPRERWVHPWTGQRCERLFLGACLSGRFTLYRSSIRPAVVVVWEGASPIGAFDQILRKLARHRAKPLPAPPGRRALRVMRLAPGHYGIEPLEHGGQELFAMFMPPKIFKGELSRL
jgi:hypothetical protein